MLKSIVVLLVGVGLALSAGIDLGEERKIHRNPNPKGDSSRNLGSKSNADEKTMQFWEILGQDLLKAKVKEPLNTDVAKNVIIFIGDGMSIPTLAATRQYLGDENVQLAFEKFPHTGLSKTYCVDLQIPDSAATASAILSGIKSNYGTLGVSGNVQFENCDSHSVNQNVDSIFKFAQDAGKATGVVTNTRVTHATPAAAYAHTPSREWENSNNIMGTDCADIASQLVYGEVGSRLNVVLGGGKGEFLPVWANGTRLDSRNLLNEWFADRSQRGTPLIVDKKADLMNLNTQQIDYLLGLFHKSHLSYMVESGRENEPTLTEMTMRALDLLEKNDNEGYVLLVEGGKIDYGHHANMARAALEETAEFHRTVEAVMARVDTKNTLVVVTSDHSHTMSIGGFPSRGADILGAENGWTLDQKPFFTINYANGKSYFDHFETTGGRKDPSTMDISKPLFVHPALVPLDSETHGGDDVAVFAIGPFSHLFSGLYEQNYIAHAIKYASCLGSGLKADGC